MFPFAKIKKKIYFKIHSCNYTINFGFESTQIDILLTKSPFQDHVKFQWISILYIVRKLYAFWFTKCLCVISSYASFLKKADKRESEIEIKELPQCSQLFSFSPPTVFANARKSPLPMHLECKRVVLHFHKCKQSIISRQIKLFVPHFKFLSSRLCLIRKGSSIIRFSDKFT